MTPLEQEDAVLLEALLFFVTAPYWVTRFSVRILLAAYADWRHSSR